VLRLPGDWAYSFFTQPAADESAAGFAPHLPPRRRAKDGEFSDAVTPAQVRDAIESAPQVR
jgi:hypothetical protein